jgi:peptidoglycan/LPS O-acetylase OafA/YrhL
VTLTPPRSRLELEPQFPVLDTVRAIGALAVLTTHTAFHSGDYIGHGIWGTLLSRLDVGVAVFLVLSGFLLSRPYLARAAAGRPRPGTGRYYWKRLLRIYPVYVLTAVIALGLLPENDGVGPGGWLRTLLLADTYGAERLPQGLTQMWSLGVEAAFYLVLPGLMLVAVGRGRPLRPGRVVAVIAVMVAIDLWWRLSLVTLVDRITGGVPMTWLPAYLIWFAVGIAIGLAHVQHQSAAVPGRAVRLLRAAGAMPGVCWTLVAALMLVAATPVAGPSLLFVASAGESMTKHLLYALVGGLVVVTGVFSPPDGRYARLMSLPLLRHLGHISFSTFCIHLPVLTLVMATTGYELFDGHGPQIWVITVALSLAASEVLYRLVERPGMRLKDLCRPGARAPGQPKSAAQTTSTKY